MPNKKDSDGGMRKGWKGHQKLDHFPSIEVGLFRVNKEEGRTCSGSLVVWGETKKSNRSFIWKATYAGGGNWQITGKRDGYGQGENCFDHNSSVNHELTVFVRDHLNDLRSRGEIFKPRPSAAAGALSTVTVTASIRPALRMPEMRMNVIVSRAPLRMGHMRMKGIRNYSL